MKRIFNKNTRLLFMITITVFLTGCESEDSYLESDYRGVIEPKAVNDYNLLLNGNRFAETNLSLGISGTGGAPLEFMSDNMAYYGESSTGASFAAYTWKKQIYIGDENPAAWTTPYRKIHVYNTVLNDIDNATDAQALSNITKVKEYKAEALLGRAVEHFFLVNLFSQPYSETNKTKPGIPYVDFADITKQLPPRETIEDTYNKIEEDLLNAIPNLPDLNENPTRGSKIGAYGMLGRMYLYKGEWEKALEFTQKALDIKSDYQDYKNVSFIFNLTDLEENVYITTNTNGELFFTQNITEEFYTTYEADDYRRNLYYQDLSGFGGGVQYGFAYFSSSKGINIPELILTKAELLVRLNRVQDALDIVNEFRIFRFKTSPTAFAASNKEEALTMVLEERRRELATQTLRWFDMRRLDVEGRMDTVTHNVADATYTLEPGSPRYTLQIPTLVIDQGGFEQNP